MSERTKLVSIDNSNKSLVEEFCANAKSSLKTFRYFDHRSLDAINSHLVTYILTLSASPIAYGHLDAEKDKVWLGVCVAEGRTGQGYGKRIMEALIGYAGENHIAAIDLSVDKVNEAAITMYNQMGFSCVDTNDKSYFMRLNLANIIGDKNE